VSSDGTAGEGPNTGRILTTLRGAALLAAEMKKTPLGMADKPLIRRAYTEAEVAVFLLRMVSEDDEAPPYNMALEKLERSVLATKMEASLEAANGFAKGDPASALIDARVARDCAAAILHSVNLESRRVTKR
jgi:hypothetical protein